MKNAIKDMRTKSESELRNEIQKLHDEIAKAQIDWAVAPGKDSNVISKKKKQIAQLQTFLREKKS